MHIFELINTLNNGKKWRKVGICVTFILFLLSNQKLDNVRYSWKL